MALNWYLIENIIKLKLVSLLVSIRVFVWIDINGPYAVLYYKYSMKKLFKLRVLIKVIGKR